MPNPAAYYTLELQPILLERNRVLPDDADGAFVRARRLQEGPYRQMIEREFARFPRQTVPLLPCDVHGLDALRRLGWLLTGRGLKPGEGWPITAKDRPE